MSLTSISWLFSVVVVGVLVNLLSSLLIKKLDPQLSRISSGWRTRSNARKAQSQKVLEALRADPQEQLMLALRVAHYQMKSVFCLFLSSMMLVTIIFHRIVVPQ